MKDGDAKAAKPVVASKAEVRLADDAAHWILLIHSIPPRPSYLRVKTARRLQKLGAVAVKNSVYALPLSDSTREDFEWIAHEITSEGGEASLCESRFVGGLTDEAIREEFRVARGRDYLEASKHARRLVDSLSKAEGSERKVSPKRRSGIEAALARLKKRRDEIIAIDHFGAPGRLELDTLISAVEDKLRPPKATDSDGAPDVLFLRAVRGKTWVTRKGIHVDRIASAWLIRRFIDPQAKLKYVEAKGYIPLSGEVRFDMFDAELTHEGDMCTFEVLLARWGVEDRALCHIGEIVHDIDLRDAKFGHVETNGFATLITGICLEHRTDEGRLAAGTTVLDAFYRALQQRAPK